jgi:hypothetical protein
MFFLQISRKQSENSLSRINKIIEKHFLRNKASLQDMLLVPLASLSSCTGPDICFPTPLFSQLLCFYNISKMPARPQDLHFQCRTLESS